MSGSPQPDTTLFIEEFLAQWVAEKTHAQVAGKVFAVFVPDSRDLPAVAYRRMRTAREYTLKGSDGKPKATFELACWAKSSAAGYAQNVAAANAIRLALDGLQTDARGQNVRNVVIEDEFDEDEPPMFEDGSLALRRLLVVSMTYTEQKRNLIGGA